MEFFGKIIKHYLLIVMHAAGVNITGDTHSEINGAMAELERYIDRRIDEALKQHYDVAH